MSGPRARTEASAFFVTWSREISVVFGAAVAAVLWSYSSAPTAQNDIPISRLAQEIQSDEVGELLVSSSGQEVTVIYDDNNRQPSRARR